MNSRHLVFLLLGGAVAAGPDTAPTTEAIEAAMAKGAAWLRAQAKDGVFVVKMKGKEMPSPGQTALALAAIASTMPADARAKDPFVKSACAFLLKSQREDGAISGGQYFDNYFTSAALMALSIVNDPAHAAAREKMKAFLLTLQRKEEGRAQGGFGYNDDGPGADLSNAQFAIEALRAAGLPESDPAMQKARAFLERVQNRSENAENKDAKWVVEDEKLGKVTVVPGNDGSGTYEAGVSKAGLEKLPDGTYVARGYGSMTYALLKCYVLTGLSPEDDRVKAAVKWIGRNYTWEENPGFRPFVADGAPKEAPYWGLFYYYMSAAKALKALKVTKLETAEGARDWRADLAAAILSRQQEDGSWRNEQSPRWEEGDPLLPTAYAVIALGEVLAAK